MCIHNKESLHCAQAFPEGEGEHTSYGTGVSHAAHEMVAFTYWCGKCGRTEWKREVHFEVFAFYNHPKNIGLAESTPSPSVTCPSGAPAPNRSPLGFPKSPREQQSLLSDNIFNLTAQSSPQQIQSTN